MGTLRGRARSSWEIGELPSRRPGEEDNGREERGTSTHYSAPILRLAPTWLRLQMRLHTRGAGSTTDCSCIILPPLSLSLSFLSLCRFSPFHLLCSISSNSFFFSRFKEKIKFNRHYYLLRGLPLLLLKPPTFSQIRTDKRANLEYRNLKQSRHQRSRWWKPKIGSRWCETIYLAAPILNDRIDTQQLERSNKSRNRRNLRRFEENRIRELYVYKKYFWYSSVVTWPTWYLGWPKI